MESEIILTEEERKAIIEAARPKWTFRHVNYKTESDLPPLQFFETYKFTEVQIGALILGKISKGWVFNQKVFMTDEQLLQRALKKMAKERRRQERKGIVDAS